jgi:hypothetical protein
VQQWGQKFTRYWPNIFTIVASAASILSLLIVFKPAGGEPFAQNVATYYVLGVATFLAAYVGVQEYRYARRASYAETLRPLHVAVHALHDGWPTVPTMSQNEFERHIQDILDAVAQAFSIATRTTCRACVKVISVDPSAPSLDSLDRDRRARHLLVRTLIRDSVSQIPGKDTTADFLTENEDFHQVFLEPSRRVFFENDLVARRKKGHYSNSHFPSDFDASKDPWPLQYRSTMVWPIKMLGQSSNLHDDHEILGFLCVDSPSKNVFVERYDFEAGALVTDALYMFMKAFFDSNSPTENSNGD